MTRNLIRSDSVLMVVLYPVTGLRNCMTASRACQEVKKSSDHTDPKLREGRSAPRC